MITPFIKKISLVLFLFLLLATAFSFGVFGLNQNKIVLGVSLGEENYSGLDFKQAAAKLQTQVNDFEDALLSLDIEGHRQNRYARELGLAPEAARILKRLQKTGHEGPLFQQLKNQLEALFLGKKITADFSLKSANIRDFFKKNLSPLETPSQNASLVFNEKTGQAELRSDQPGLTFDKAALLDSLFQSVSELEPIAKIELRLRPTQALIKTEQAQIAFSTVQKILGKSPVVLKAGEKSWEVKAPEVFAWLNFYPAPAEKLKETPIETPDQTDSNQADLNHEEEKMILFPGFNEDKIKEDLAVLAPTISQKSVNARLKQTDGKVEIARKSQKEQSLEIKKSAALIQFSLYEGKREINLAVNEKPAEINEENLDKLGLTDFLGAGDSNFIGSSNSRIHNVKLGAAKFDSLLVKPGVAFSFNELLGEVDAAQGYLPELVIKDKKTIPEYGGGLCQVSTTIFRAAIKSGFKITERFHHAFPVKYYNPQGFDATIYPPHPDLRFLNDTPKNIYLQAEIEGSVITFEIFGAADGREVKVIGPVVLEAKEDGSMKTNLTQEIWRNGILERTQSFYSAYKSPALYTVPKNPLE